MQQPDLKEVFKTVLAGAEEQKKAGDLMFAHQQFEEAAETYTKACKGLGSIWGFPFGEIVAIRSLANQAQCYLKLGKHEEAAVACDTALSVPSVVQEQHLCSKIFKRRGTAYEQLAKLAPALVSYDWAIRFGDDTEDTAMARERVVAAISEKEEGFVAIPPPPDAVEKATITKLITAILQSKCDCDAVAPLIQALVVNKRAAVDLHDEQKNNMFWAVCQAAIMRASTPDMEADDVLPVLELLILNGGRANQRFVIKGAYRTPLQMMAVAGAHECCSLLLKSGAPMQVLDQRGWSALEVACAVDHPRHKAKASSNHEVVTVLLEAKANPQFKIPGSGMTALSLAAQGGDGESVMSLLGAGAVVNVRCAIGFSPLVWAMIGNGPKPFKANRAFMVLFHKITECKMPALLDEAKEDIKCFHLSAMLHEMRLVKKKVFAEEATPAQITALKPVFQSLLLQNIRRRVGLPPKEDMAAAMDLPKAPDALPPTPPSGEESSAVSPAGGESEAPKDVHKHSTDEANVLLRICSVLMPQYIPRILTRKWTVKAEHEDKKDVRAALANANPIERCWLSTVMSAVTGPMKSELLLDFSSDLSPSASNDYSYGVIGCYSDFVEMVRGTIAKEYSPFIPAGPLLDEIAAAQFVVAFDDHNNYWAKLLRLCRLLSASDAPMEEGGYCEVIDFDLNDTDRPAAEEGVQKSTDQEDVNAVAAPDQKAIVTCTKERPALLVFSEPSVHVDLQVPKKKDDVIIHEKLESLVKLLNVYHDSNTVFVVGQKTGSDCALFETSLGYKCTSAIEHFLTERGFTRKILNPAAAAQPEVKVESADTKTDGDTPAKTPDAGMPLPHWPFEIVSMNVWQKPRSE